MPTQDATISGIPRDLTREAALQRYRRPFGVLHEPKLRQEIARLDAQRDCQRIVHLLFAYEFPFDIVRSVEIALFHTYGSRSISRLLDRTGEFSRRGQQRYDDTALLIGHFVESGWDSAFGQRAIARMNQIHARYRIPNDDFVFVLWTFIDFPLQWTDDFGWRAFTDHERSAWFNFWVEVGKRMGMRDIPDNKSAYDAFVRDYEARNMIYDDASRRVALATVAIMQGWLPGPLRPLVLPVIACLVRPQFTAATGFPAPSWPVNLLVRGGLKLRARVKSMVSLERYPTLLAHRKHRTYPQGYAIEELGPR